MTAVGIRQIRQYASTYVRRVADGETIQITDRGRPVALLVPIPSKGGVARLEAEGRLIKGQGDFLRLPPPVKPKPGVPLPSQILARAREHER